MALSVGCSRPAAVEQKCVLELVSIQSSQQQHGGQLHSVKEQRRKVLQEDRSGCTVLGRQGLAARWRPC